MRPYYTQNARQLLESRQQGMIPNGPVVVSLVSGQFDHPALFVHADMPCNRLDWRMLVNLPVWVFVNKSITLEKIVEMVFRIALSKPKELIIRFVQGDNVHDVEVGYGHHLPAIANIAAVHEFQWSPINVGGTEIGKRLVKALKSKKQSGEKL